MNLLQIHDESIVSKTTLSRKLTLGGVTKAYPVYRVRLDQLYYNDQNDRRPSNFNGTFLAAVKKGTNKEPPFPNCNQESFYVDGH